MKNSELALELFNIGLSLVATSMGIIIVGISTMKYLKGL